MKLLKIYLISLLVISATSCQSDIGKISNVKKSVIYPGVPQAEKFVRYRAEIELYKPVKILKITIQNKDATFDVEKYSLISLENGKIMDRTAEIKEGRYLFSANVTPVENFENSDDQLIIQVSTGDKETEFKVKVEKDEPVFRK